jgi:hypothetical protein
MRNNLITDNSVPSGSGGGIFSSGALSTTFIYNTITENSNYQTVLEFRSGNVMNSIVSNACGDSNSFLYGPRSSNAGNISYNLLSGAIRLGFLTPVPMILTPPPPRGFNIVDNISGDPLFVDTDADDYHLQSITDGFPDDSECLTASQSGGEIGAYGNSGSPGLSDSSNVGPQ